MRAMKIPDREYFFEGRLSRRLRLIHVDDLRVNKVNPTDRSTETSARLLIESIQRIGGLINPVHVMSDGEILGGHGRRRAAKKLGWDHIPAYVYSGDRGLAMEIYSEDSRNRLFTGKQQVQVIIKGGPAINGEKSSANRAVKLLRDIYDHEELTKMNGSTPAPCSVNTAKQVSTLFAAMIPEASDWRKSCRAILNHMRTKESYRYLNEWVRSAPSDASVREHYRKINSGLSLKK